MGMKYFEMIKFIEDLIINHSDSGVVTPEDVQIAIDQHGYGRESMYNHLKRKLMRRLNSKGLPELETSTIERECNKWIYNRV